MIMRRGVIGLAIVNSVVLGVCVGLLIAVYPCFADDGAKLTGIWKLVTYGVEIQATGQKEPLFGQNATGYLILTPEGRMMAIITAGGRTPPKTTQDRADLLNSMVAYTGMYRVEGDKWIVKIDVAWNPGYLAEQTRFFKVDGDRLDVLTAWAINPNWPEKGMQRGILTFERVK